MFQLCDRVSPVRLENQVWQTQILGGWREIVDQSGDSPIQLGVGWAPRSCLDFWGAAYLLLLSHDSGAGAAWVLDSDLRFVCDFDWLNAEVSVELFSLFRSVSTNLLKSLRLNPVQDGADQGLSEILAHHPHVAGVFAKLADKTARNVGAGPILARGDKWQGELEMLYLDRLLANAEFIDQIHGGQLRFQLSQKNGSDVTVMIRRTNSHPTYYCQEFLTGLIFYLCVMPDGTRAVYLPRDNVFLTRSVAFSVIDTLNYIDAGLVSLAIELFNQKIFLLEQSDTVGLFTSGIPNFGHAIWDEFQAIERVIAKSQALYSDTNFPSLPWLYYVPGFTGVELYGAIDDLYREFAGRVAKLPNETVIFAHAIKNRLSVVLRTGQRATLESRRRIMQVVNDDAKRRGLDQAVAKVTAKAGISPLVVTFGLRLSNRVPVNMMELYIHLARRLYAIYGPFVIVVDGMNGGDDPLKAATVVFNGVGTVETSFLEAQRNGSDEISKENVWIADFERELSDINVTIVNCVGSPIRANLFWMSQSRFFVAPLGGGLAKLRWAQDIPGFVLSSRINLEKCLLLHAYDDEAQMDAPFSPLGFNSLDEVEDLPLNPPRTVPAAPHGIPHPENYRISLSVVENIVSRVMKVHDIVS